LPDISRLIPRLILHSELELNAKVLTRLTNDASSDLTELLGFVFAKQMVHLVEQIHRFLDVLIPSGLKESTLDRFLVTITRTDDPVTQPVDLG
jgi:hypothetical protein